MELESQSGSKITLQNQTKLGRKSLSQTPDKTISRHHITLNPNTQKQETLNFVVYGKNPIFVLHEKDGEIKVYKRGDKGEMKVGDGFCFGFKDFVWFKVKGIGGDEDVKKMEELGVDFDEIGSAGGEGENLDLSESSDVVDPVQEFRFLVIGHEFDHYPKKKIRDIRNWDWFLEEHKEEDSDEDDVIDTKPKKGKRRKRKKGGANDDEDDDVWTGESEEDAEVIKKLKNDNKPKYSTRSKDQKKNKKGASTSKSSHMMDVDVEDEDDEEDETLGGFIVDDEDAGEEIDEVLDEETDEDDEEEEFEEDEDDE